LRKLLGDELAPLYEQRMKETETRKTEVGSSAPIQQDTAEEPVPTRLTIDLEGETYRFSAITRDAAVPERLIPVSPKLVEQGNDLLAQASDPEDQKARGSFMERFLFHEDFRPHLATTEPLVLLLDPRTARIHWEMFAQPDPAELARTDRSESDLPDEPGDGSFNRYNFLGTARGLTRQLRTTFAPPPEPPPPPRRRLRVLIVADPADDASLPGAEQEGIAVADLFDEYNRIYGGDTDTIVEVEHLSGPTAGSLVDVMTRLTTRPYDLFHFAGHCYYNEQDPPSSGYIFHLNPREVLSVRELNRIDRVPKFVFSNACESGITQDRIDKRNPGIPPSFAEAFFARGVANFVCTAWPVDDLAARVFALKLYSGLLGLATKDDGQVTGSADPLPIYQAMQEARVTIAATANGAQTWGAYQHYGNPFFRFFAPRRETPESGGEQGRRPTTKHTRQHRTAAT
jgi:CHAT domain-containing protein